MSLRIREGRSLLNNNITITPTLSTEVSGMYMTGMRQGYMVVEPMGNFSIGLRQQLMKNKMTLSLTVNMRNEKNYRVISRSTQEFYSFNLL
jgi:hypothetical protein